MVSQAYSRNFFFFFLKKGSLMCATIAHMKQQEYALHAKTFDKLNPDLKGNLNRHPFIWHLIQVWIRFKKLYFHGKWQNCFTHKYLSTFIICRNFIWIKKRIYITIFSEKFLNQCKEHTNSKVPSNILSLLLYMPLSWIWRLSLCYK